MEIQIRYYKQSDYNMLIRILRDVYGSTIDQAILESVYISEKRSIIVAVTEEEQLVGCTFLEVQEDYIRPSRTLYITYVAVDKKYRENGIGRKLICKVEEICKDEGCSAIELTSADFRIEAHAFYKKLGFTKKKTTLFIKEIR